MTRVFIELEIEHEMHILKFYDFVTAANACGADKGKTTIKCEDCDVKFAFEYEREQTWFNIKLYHKEGGEFHYFKQLAIMSKNTAVGIS